MRADSKICYNVIFCTINDYPTLLQFYIRVNLRGTRGVWGTPGLTKENGEQKLGYWMCFQELMVEDVEKWGKSYIFWGKVKFKFPMKTFKTVARKHLFHNFKSLKSALGHVLANGTLSNSCQEARILHDSNIG